MITSEFEYYLISELITMPDRELAQKIELHIWFQSLTPQPKILAMYLKALKYSEDPESFFVTAKLILQESGMEFVPVEGTPKLVGRTLSYKPPGYIKITGEQLLKAEEQEPQNDL